MNIVPLSSSLPTQVSSMPANAGLIGRGVHEGVPFSNMFRDALASVNETHEVSRQDTMNLAMGEIDDIAAMNVNAARANLAFDLLVQMRNRVLEAYQEMMRMSV